jgi:hypothetical protein
VRSKIFALFLPVCLLEVIVGLREDTRLALDAFHDAENFWLRIRDDVSNLGWDIKGVTPLFWSLEDC